MRTLPTAQQFCEDLDDELGEWWSSDYEELAKRVDEYAIMKAKFHVEAALKAANLQVIVIDGYEGREADDNYYTDSDSILNAYPLSNIK